MNDAIKKAQKIEELTGEIREIIDEGFFLEDYHKFSRNIENKLSEVEVLTQEIYMIARKVG